jgi:hypothetical protein
MLKGEPVVALTAIGARLSCGPMFYRKEPLKIGAIEGIVA